MNFDSQVCYKIFNLEFNFNSRVWKQKWNLDNWEFLFRKKHFELRNFINLRTESNKTFKTRDEVNFYCTVGLKIFNCILDKPSSLQSKYKFEPIFNSLILFSWNFNFIILFNALIFQSILHFIDRIKMHRLQSRVFILTIKMS